MKKNFVEKMYPIPRIQELAKKKGIRLSIGSNHVDVISVLPRSGKIKPSWPVNQVVQGLTRLETYLFDLGWEGKPSRYLSDPGTIACIYCGTDQWPQPRYSKVCYPCGEILHNAEEITERHKQAYEYGRRLRKILNPPSAFDKERRCRFDFIGVGGSLRMHS